MGIQCYLHYYFLYNEYIIPSDLLTQPYDIFRSPLKDTFDSGEGQNG